MMSTESLVNTSKPGLHIPIDILDIISDSVNMQNFHSKSGVLVLSISRFYWYCKSLIFPSHLFCCWLYVSLDLPMMQKFLLILCIIFPGIYSSLALSYLNSAGIPWSSHRYIRPSPPYSFDLIGATNMNYPEANTCAILFPNNDGTFLYKGSA